MLDAHPEVVGETQTHPHTLNGRHYSKNQAGSDVASLNVS